MSAARASSARPQPAFDWFTTGLAKFDAVQLFTIYAALLMLIPATLIFAPLGGEGTPALVFSVVVLLWYILSWITGQLEPSGGGRLVRIAMLLFSLAVLVSFVAAMTRDISSEEALAADRALLWLISGVGLVVVAAEAITDYQRLDVLLRRLVILGSIVAVIGILQFRGIDLTRFMHIPGLTVNQQAGVADLSRGGHIRPNGTTTQPIEFGVVMAMLLPIALQQAFDPSRGTRFRRWAPVVLIGVAGPLTVSRSAILGLIAGLVFLFPTWRGRRKFNALIVFIGCLGAIHLLVHGLIGTFFGLFQGIFNGQDASVNARTADYSGVSQYIAQRPVFGRGIGTFLPDLYRFTDNMYLLATVEIGLVGVLLMIFLFIAGIRSAAAGRRRTTDEHQREIGQAFVATMIVAMVSSFTFDSLTFPMFSGLFFLLLGCSGAYCGIMTANARKAAFEPGPSSLAVRFRR
jgi:hypothetical protein